MDMGSAANPNAVTQALQTFRRKVADIRHTFRGKAEGIHHQIDEKRIEKLKRLIETQK